MARSIFFYTDSRDLGGAEFALLMLIENLDPALATDPAARRRPGLAGRSPSAPRHWGRRCDASRRCRWGWPAPAGDSIWPACCGRERPAIFHAHLSWPLAAKWALAASVLARLPTRGDDPADPGVQPGALHRGCSCAPSPPGSTATSPSRATSPTSWSSASAGRRPRSRSATTRSRSSASAAPHRPGCASRSAAMPSGRWSSPRPGSTSRRDTRSSCAPRRSCPASISSSPAKAPNGLGWKRSPASWGSPSAFTSSATATTSPSCSPPATSSLCPRCTRAPRWRCWRRWRRGGRWSARRSAAPTS